METSKKLLWIFVYFLIIPIILVGAIDVVFKTNLSYLLSYSVPVSTSVILTYMGKSGFENVTKIKTNPSNGFSVENGGNSIEVQTSEVLNDLTNIPTTMPLPADSILNNNDNVDV